VNDLIERIQGILSQKHMSASQLETVVGNVEACPWWFQQQFCTPMHIMRRLLQLSQDLGLE